MASASYGSLDEPNEKYTTKIGIEDHHTINSTRSRSVIFGACLAFLLVLGYFYTPSMSHETQNAALVGRVEDVEEKSKHAGGKWYHSFGKWTLTSSSMEFAQDSVQELRLAMNFLTLKRNNSIDPGKYALVGPTGCKGVTRAWAAERYLVGDNQFHFVANTNDVGTVKQGNITVKAWREYLFHLHSKEMNEWDQFMDNMMTSYAYEIDPYVATAKNMADMYGWKYAFRKGVTDNNANFYSVVMMDKDAHLFEMMSANLNNASYDTYFEYDECYYRPLGNMTQKTGSIFFNYDDEISGIAGLKNYVNVDETEPVSSQPLTTPFITHIASTDPATDADFLMKYLNAYDSDSSQTLTRVTTMERAAGVTESKCRDYKSEWLMISSEFLEHYIHLAYHPQARYDTFLGEKFTLRKWQRYLTELRKDMNKNVYDVFMDDHVGLEAQDAYLDSIDYFAAIAKKMSANNVSILTRREPYTGEPSLWETQKTEKFSIFFHLPVSFAPFQILYPQGTQSQVLKTGMPKFCDWDFCPNFANYRNGKKLTSSSECGFGDYKS